jgi:AraC-like DNA-binding protein
MGRKPTAADRSDRLAACGFADRPYTQNSHRHRHNRSIQSGLGLRRRVLSALRNEIVRSVHHRTDALSSFRTIRDKGIRLVSLAGVAAMSTHHFAHRYKETVGMSPHAHVRSRRVRHAYRQAVSS